MSSFHIHISRLAAAVSLVESKIAEATPCPIRVVNTATWYNEYFGAINEMKESLIQISDLVESAKLKEDDNQGIFFHNPWSF